MLSGDKCSSLFGLVIIDEKKCITFSTGFDLKLFWHKFTVRWVFTEGGFHRSGFSPNALRGGFSPNALWGWWFTESQGWFSHCFMVHSVNHHPSGFSPNALRGGFSPNALWGWWFTECIIKQRDTTPDIRWKTTPKEHSVKTRFHPCQFIESPFTKVPPHLA